MLIEPFVPPETDLRDYPSILLDIDRLLNSDFNAIVDDRAWRAGLTLWLKSYRQLPASSLPDDDASLAGMVGYGRELKAWDKARPSILRHWELCSDGRRYHRVVSEKALEAWISRLNQRAASGEANLKRWQVAYDAEAIHVMLDRAKKALAALNPDARLLRSRTKKGPHGHPHGDPHGHPHGDPDGGPGGMPGRSPRGSRGDTRGQSHGDRGAIPGVSQAKAEVLYPSRGRILRLGPNCGESGSDLNDPGYGSRAGGPCDDLDTVLFGRSSDAA